MVCSANHENVIDTVFEEFSLTAENIAKKWGYDALSDKMKESFHKQDDDKYSFFQAVFPKGKSPFYDDDEYSIGYRSLVVCTDDHLIMEEGQYRLMPYIIGRYEACPNQIYGNSPTIKALAAIRRLNELSNSMSVYSELSLKPPYNAPKEVNGLKFHIRPGEINYGAMDKDGRPLIRPVGGIGNPVPSKEEAQRLQNQIQEIYMLDLFQVLADRASRSAAESMEKTREKGVFISAIVGGLQAEFLGSMVRREIDVLLGQIGSNRGELDIVKISYTEPLRKYQMAEEVAGTMQAFAALSDIAVRTGNPELLAVINEVKLVYEGYVGILE